MVHYDRDWIPRPSRRPGPARLRHATRYRRSPGVQPYRGRRARVAPPPPARPPAPPGTRAARERRSYGWAFRRSDWRRGPRMYDAAEPEDGYTGRERRSGEDRRRLTRGPDRRTDWRSRGREFVRRFREPLIGLGVAAAAAPIARAASQPQQGQAPQSGATQQSAAEPAGDLEEAIGQRWAATDEARVREDTISGAMARYGIQRDLAEDIYDAAISEGIEPDVAFGLVNTESSFRQRAVSHVGARGLTQVMPATARWLNPNLRADDLFDRDVNLHLGFGYLRQLVDKYDGNLRLALLAYNRGPGTVDRVLSQGGDPNNGYADAVLSG